MGPFKDGGVHYRTKHSGATGDEDGEYWRHMLDEKLQAKRDKTHPSIAPVGYLPGDHDILWAAETTI